MRNITKLMLSVVFLFAARTPDAANAQCGTSFCTEYCTPDCNAAYENCEQLGGRICELCACFFTQCTCNPADCCVS